MEIRRVTILKHPNQKPTALKNQAVRDYAKARGVRLYELAELYKVSISTFTRKLYNELDMSSQLLLMENIDYIAENRNKEPQTEPTEGTEPTEPTE